MLCWKMIAIRGTLPDHFQADCFDSASSVKLSVGYPIQHKRVLLDVAVPTIFVRTLKTVPKTKHKSTTVISTVSVTDIDGSTMLVPIETTKVVASNATSRPTRERSSSRLVLAKKARVEVRKFTSAFREL